MKFSNILFILLFSSSVCAGMRSVYSSAQLSEDDKKALNDYFFKDNQKPILISGMKYQLSENEEWISYIVANFKAHKSSTNVCKSKRIQASFTGPSSNNINYKEEQKNQHYDTTSVWLQKENDCDLGRLDESTTLTTLFDDSILVQILSHKKMLLDSVITDTYKTNVPVEIRIKYLDAKIESLDVFKKNEELIFEATLDRGSNESWLKVRFQLIDGHFIILNAISILS